MRERHFYIMISLLFFSRYEQALDTHIFLWLGEILCIWPQCMVCFYTILYMPIYYLMPFITPFCAKGETDTPNLLICFQFMSILKLLATFRTIKNIKNECVWYLEVKICTSYSLYNYKLIIDHRKSLHLESTLTNLLLSMIEKTFLCLSAWFINLQIFAQRPKLHPDIDWCSRWRPSLQ